VAPADEGWLAPVRLSHSSYDMKPSVASLFLSLLLPAAAHADLVIMQKLEGAGSGTTEITLKIKGDKARVEASPELTTIVDTRTGELINLMKDQKTVVRVSADKMKAVAEMMNRYNKNGKQESQAKLVRTGQTEKVNGYDTEEYACQTSHYKVSYWVAANYPNGPAIWKQLQSLNPRVWMANSADAPDYRDLPGLPIKTVISSDGNRITATITSVNEMPLSDSEFMVPPDFHDLKIPELGNLLKPRQPQPKASPSP